MEYESKLGFPFKVANGAKRKERRNEEEVGGDTLRVWGNECNLAGRNTASTCFIAEKPDARIFPKLAGCQVVSEREKARKR